MLGSSNPVQSGLALLFSVDVTLEPKNILLAGILGAWGAGVV